MSLKFNPVTAKFDVVRSWSVLDSRYVNITGDTMTGNLLMADGINIQTDQIRARDGDGLKLYDDGGNGIFVEDGGHTRISGTTNSLYVYFDGTGQINQHFQMATNNMIFDTSKTSINPTYQFRPASGSTSKGAIVEIYRTLSDGTLINSGQWRVQNSVAGNPAMIFQTTDTNTQPIEFRTYNGTIGYIAFSPKGVEKVRIDPDGNVGIEETSPGAKLQVNTGAAATKGLIVKGAASQSANLQEWQNSDALVMLAVTDEGYLMTDRWLQSEKNVFLGEAAAGGGGLVHAAGFEGWYNVMIGYEAGYDITTGYENVGLGFQTMSNLTTGYRNTAFGSQALAATTDGQYNVAFGWQALYTAGTALRNVGIGSEALKGLTTGYDNVAIGAESAMTLTDAHSCVAIGRAALKINTTGYENIAIGLNAMIENTEGYRNVAIGTAAMNANTTSDYSVAIGWQALKTGTDSITGNVAIGATALAACTKGSNVAVGYRALTQATSAQTNVAIGRDAGYSTTTGDGCVFIGYAAGYNETNSNRLYIANSNTATPLIYGEFDTPLLVFNTTARITDKLQFTQTDGNEYIDSLNDGYMDYGATTLHRFNNPLTIANIKTGADQASAGAAAGELWATASHASLPDNVVMIGV